MTDQKSTGQKIVYVARYTLHISHFLVNNHSLHYSKHYLLITVNLIYSNIHIIPTVIFNTIISILQYCNYIVTILITITYSYIYRYILSIKRNNSQYRYKYTDSIIRIILNNTEINIYTVYTYHIYTIINTILAYSNFLLAYHSYLPLKQWIIKLYEKCITEYFSFPYDLTSEHKNGATGLLRPLSGIIVVQLLYTIIYIIFIPSFCIKLAALFCAIFSIDISGVLRIIKAYRAKHKQTKKQGGNKQWNMEFIGIEVNVGV